MRIYPMTISVALLLLLSSICSGGDFAKGQQAYDAGDYETALTEWQPLAEAGTCRSARIATVPSYTERGSSSKAKVTSSPGG